MLASRAEGRYLRLGEPANPPPGPGINYIRRSFAHTLVKPAVSVLRKRPPHALAYLLVRRSRTVAGFRGEGGGQGQERGSGHAGGGRRKRGRGADNAAAATSCKYRDWRFPPVLVNSDF